MAKINPIDLQKHLKGANYPASKADLVSSAGQQGADQELLSTLKQLLDQQYEGPTEVNHAIAEAE